MFPGIYVPNPTGRRAVLLDGTGTCSVEEYARSHFRRLGYRSYIFENAPIHVLFGVYMASLIQDPSDRRNRPVWFGNRHTFNKERRGELIKTSLPDDFGTRGYGMRRAEAAKKHLSVMSREAGELQRLFDFRLAPSEDLRQYLWAHRAEDIEIARQFISIFPGAKIIQTLQYLVEDYWGHSAGWPDLLVYREKDFFLAEVKSAGDKLAAKQERWIRDNHKRLHFPFKLVKVSKEFDQNIRAGLAATTEVCESSP